MVSLTEANGVTLLALGNGAPDIFSAFAAINQSDDHKSSLAIGALFGTIAPTKYGRFPCLWELCVFIHGSECYAIHFRFSYRPLSGAGIFVSTVVVGGVAFLEKFTLTKRPFLRDIIFYTIAVYWTFYLLWTNTVTIYMAAGKHLIFIHTHILTSQISRTRTQVS